tara:strand:+ start:1251 stop:1559 length:309 start_codon:yes stop_codon:yes gene_type:complete
MRHFTVYVKKGKGVSEVGKFSTNKGTPGSIARKGATSVCKKSKAKVCKRKILVREHGGNVVKEYDGKVQKLKKAEKVKFSGMKKPISFKKKSSVKYVRTLRV